MRTISEIRPSPIAGQWYSGNSAVLKKEIQQYLDQAMLPELSGEVVGLVAPHAGYRYSGQTAAYSYKTIVGKCFDLVILLSPYHQYHPAMILSSQHAYYQTPLGNVQVDHEILSVLSTKLNEQHEIEVVKISHDHEHSLEIELPFLQVALENNFQLLPLMIRGVDPNITEQIATTLAESIKNRNALIVCSTDLSHFYPQKIAKNYDEEMLDRIKTLSSYKIYEAEANQLGFACGLGAVMVGVQTCKLLGANEAEILHHSTSGEVTGDNSSVVGYGSVAILRSSLLGN